MATSFYVYDNMDIYNKINQNQIADPLFHADLIDVFVIPFDHIILVTNTNNQKESINMSKTIIHARNGILPNELIGMANLIKYDKIRFDAKKKKLHFNPRFLRKSQYETRVDRYYGDLTKGKFKLNYQYKFYDFIRDRVNLIIF